MTTPNPAELSDLFKPDEDKTTRGLLTMLTEAAVRGTGARKNTPGYRAALERTPRKWLCAMFPAHFRGLDQFAPHHDQYWSHVWGLETDVAPPACFAVWNRKGMKSTSAEATGPALAALGKRKFGLYVGGTQDKADAHLESVKDMLIESNLPNYYPSLAKPKVKKVDNRTIPGTWNHAELETEGGLTMMAVGLDVSVRGLRKGNQRFDFCIIDDIEDEDDSIPVVNKKINRLAASILPAGSLDNCAVFFVQNLIHRDSVISQCLDGRAGILQERIVCGDGPIPALLDDEYETTGTGSSRRSRIIKGTPTWSGFDLERCQAELYKVGLRVWLTEYQHRVNTPYENAIFPGFDEIYHVITWDEFAPIFAKFGSYDANNQPRIPTRGFCGVTFDQGTTIAHPSVALWDWQPAAEMPCNGDLFFYRELCRPHFPNPIEGEVVVPEEVGMAIQDAEREWQDNVRFRQGSHEAKAVRNSFGFFLGRIPGYKNMSFAPIETKFKKQGIVGVQDLLGIDWDKPHPFRIDPRTLNGESVFCSICSRYHDGKHLRGKPGMFVVAAKGQGELTVDYLGKLQVAPALDESGFSRTRWEFPRYRNRKTAAGVEGQEAPKIDDDAMDGVIAAVAHRRMHPQAMTEEMKAIALMPKKLRPEFLATLPASQRPAADYCAYTARAEAMHEIKQSQQPTGYRPLSRRFNRRIF